MQPELSINMKTLLMLTAVLATVQIAHSLKCTKCNNCETAKSNSETCRNLSPDDSSEAVCIEQIVRLHGSVGPMTIRRCETAPKNTQYQCRTLPDSTPVSCRSCKSDYCNKAPSIAVSTYLTLGLVALTLKSYL